MYEIPIKSYNDLILKGICDGAAAVVLASEDAVKEYNLKPLARFVGYSYVGVQPEIMGIGPVPAIQNVLKATALKLEDMDLVEVRYNFNNLKNPKVKNTYHFCFYFNRSMKPSVHKH